MGLYDGLMSVISVSCTDLTDREMMALCLSLQLGTDPRQIKGYEKVRELYTEENGTRMHEATKKGFLSLCAARLQ